MKLALYILKEDHSNKSIHHAMTFTFNINIISEVNNEIKSNN